MKAMILSLIFLSLLAGLSWLILYLTRLYFIVIEKVDGTKWRPIAKDFVKMALFLVWTFAGMLIEVIGFLGIVNRMFPLVGGWIKILMLMTLLGPTLVFCWLHFHFKEARDKEKRAKELQPPENESNQTKRGSPKRFWSNTKNLP